MNIMWGRRKNGWSEKWSCFCCVGSSCEDVDSNQWLPLQCTNFACTSMVFILVKVKCYIDVHVKPTSMLTWLFNLTIGHCQNFKECFGYMWMEIQYNFIGTKQFGQPIMLCTFWHENLRRWSAIDLFPSSRSHKIPAHFRANLSGQRSYLLKDDTWTISYVSLQSYNLKSKKLFMLKFFPWNNSFAMFQDPMDKSHFETSKLVHANFTTNIEWNALKTTLS